MSACFLFLSFIHSHRHTLPSTYVPQTCLTSSILSSSSLQLLLWWCPSSPLLFNVAWWCHHQDQDALCSICRRGRPFILYYVALIGPDRAPPNCWVRGNEGPSPGQGRAEGGPFTGPVGTAASQIFNVAQSFVFESAFKFSNIQCFMVKVENGGKWMNHSCC